MNTANINVAGARDTLIVKSLPPRVSKPRCADRGFSD
jgi:hypothetical protein